MVHVIDKVMVPPTQNIYDIIKNGAEYSIVAKVLNGTKVEEMLQNEKLSITFLAPTDEALGQISEKDMDALVKDKEKADNILLNHVLKGNCHLWVKLRT